MEYQTIIDFWFNELTSDDYFTQSDSVDERIKSFFGVHAEVVLGTMSHWRGTPEGALAEVIVLDQFSRNMFRDSDRAFAYDMQALILAEEAIEKGFDMELSVEKRMFLYMPYMHSESREVHIKAVQLFESLGIESTLQYEHTHKDIIDAFGRYPHRNKILGRENTVEEEKYLAEKGESFF